MSTTVENQIGSLMLKRTGTKVALPTSLFFLLLEEEGEVEGERKGCALAADHGVAGEAIGIDVGGSGASLDCSHVLCHAHLLDGAGDRGEGPAGDAEEVEEVHDEGHEDDAGERLGEVGQGVMI